MIVKIYNQLGNQMFMYASIKSVCEETGNKFQYYLDDTVLSNSKDSQFGNTIDKIFNLEPSEKVESLPNEAVYFRERIKSRQTNYLPGLKNLRDNSVLDGLFQSNKYFEHNKHRVEEWFEFDENLKSRCIKIIEDISRKYDNESNYCFVHFRQGNDYKKFGYALSLDYYKKSLSYLNEFYKSKVIFLVFYDMKNSKIDELFNGYNYEFIHGSLVEDLCCMTQCSSGIISNSTFSWWGAYLQKNAEIIIRPSNFYAFGTSISPQDIFPCNWIAIEAKRSLQTKIFGYFIEKSNGTRKYMKKNYSGIYSIIKRFFSKLFGLSFNKL